MTPPDTREQHRPPQRRRAANRGNAAEDAFDRLEKAQQEAAAMTNRADDAWSTPAPDATGAEVVHAPDPAAPMPADAFVEKLARGDVPTLEDCEKHITAITTQWLLAVGRALAAIRDHELFRDKGYTSFTAYLKNEHPWHPSYVSRVIADIPVVEALAEHGVDRDLNEGQASAVRPVLEEHGREALYDVWDSTEGKKSAAALVRVARAKGYLPLPRKPRPRVGLPPSRKIWRASASSPIWWATARGSVSSRLPRRTRTGARAYSFLLYDRQWGYWNRSSGPKVDLVDKFVISNGGRPAHGEGRPRRFRPPSAGHVHRTCGDIRPNPYKTPSTPTRHLPLL
ncbi:hypothetical protein ACFQ0B_81750 [Nonomuraea thailandensis]